MSDEFEPSAASGDETPGSESPGARLREVRESHQLTLGQVALSLHVDEGLLRSLENDDYSKLGAPIFVKGHLRNYARLLELDAVELIRIYEKYHQPVDPALSNRVPEGPRMERGASMTWLRWLGAVLLLILLIVLAGWWYYRQEVVPSGLTFDSGEPLEQLAERQPDAAQARTAAEGNSSVDMPAAAGETDAGPASGNMSGNSRGNEAAQQQERTSSADQGTDEPVAETGEAAAPAERDSEDFVVPANRLQTVPGESNSSAAIGEPQQAVERRILLEFSGESWVEVYDDNDQPLLYDLKTAGTRHVLDVSGPVRLFLGNAPEVRITVNGESLDVARFTRRDNTARFRIPPER